MVLEGCGWIQTMQKKSMDEKKSRIHLLTNKEQQTNAEEGNTVITLIHLREYFKGSSIVNHMHIKFTVSHLKDKM